MEAGGAEQARQVTFGRDENVLRSGIRTDLEQRKTRKDIDQEKRGKLASLQMMRLSFGYSVSL